MILHVEKVYSHVQHGIFRGYIHIQKHVINTLKWTLTGEDGVKGKSHKTREALRGLES